MSVEPHRRDDHVGPCAVLVRIKHKRILSGKMLWLTNRLRLIITLFLKCVGKILAYGGLCSKKKLITYSLGKYPIKQTVFQYAKRKKSSLGNCIRTEEIDEAFLGYYGMR